MISTDQNSSWNSVPATEYDLFVLDSNTLTAPSYIQNLNPLHEPITFKCSECESILYWYGEAKVVCKKCGTEYDLMDMSTWGIDEPAC